MFYRLRRLADTDPQLVEQLRQFCFDINGCCHQVHREMGPWLNEYMYQDALTILFKEKYITYTKEFYFSVNYHGQQISHRHYVDFMCKDKIFLECKAIEKLGSEQRQQLWNYMRLTKVCVGILFNFAPVQGQCEHYYLDVESGIMYVF